MSDKGDAAIEQFRSGLNCAQSVFAAFAEALDLDSEIALKIAAGFGAGISYEQEVCGAVSGAVMVLGLMNIQPIHSINENKKAAYIATSDFIKRFKERFGAIICREILQGCDLKTEEGRSFYSTQNLFENRCIPCVKTAVQILESKLNIEKQTC